MLLATYIMSALLCIIMFASIAVNTSTVVPTSDRLGVGAVAVFLILCPVINTLIAVAGLASGVYVFFIGYK